MQARFNSLIALTVCAAAAVSANAAEPRWPTPDEIKAARSRSPMPSIEDIMRQAIPAVPNVNPKPPALNLEDMARRYSANREAFDKGGTVQPQLRIFVTLAMPEASLKLLARQASKTQATIVIRGLKDESMKSTLAAVQRVIGELPVDWQIDPPAFRRFGIERAPTFVLTAQSASTIAPRGCTTGCDKPDVFVSVSGDVSLDYALGVIVRTKPAFTSDAQRFLLKLANPVTQ